jgi:hypothetical protein
MSLQLVSTTKGVRSRDCNNNNQQGKCQCERSFDVRLVNKGVFFFPPRFLIVKTLLCLFMKNAYTAVTFKTMLHKFVQVL